MNETGPDRPSRHGAMLGRALGEMVEVAGGAPGMCATCAFRPGTVPNESAGTALTAWKCAIGIDSDPFGCHHGLADGQPKRLCAGWDATRNLPLEPLKPIMDRLRAALDESHEGEPDPIRERYDAWLRTADPEGRLDVYQIARAWERDHTGARP